ncbi:MAG: DUF1538 family protein [Gaiellales bacterium]
MSDTRRELTNTSMSVAPVAACAAALLIAVTAPTTGSAVAFAGGVLMTIAGLTLFLEGVRIALLPAGEALGSSVTSTGSITLLLGFGALLGALVTLAEPDVRILASQLERADALAASRMTYIVVVSVGVGISISLAFLRAVLAIPLIPLMAVGYSIVGVMAWRAPSEALAHAFDFGAVTTGPISVPVLLALNTGVVAVLGGRGDPSRSFGLLGIASMGPIIAVLGLALVTA